MTRDLSRKRTDDEPDPPAGLVRYVMERVTVHHARTATAAAGRENGHVPTLHLSCRGHDSIPGVGCRSADPVERGTKWPFEPSTTTAARSPAPPRTRTDPT
ncbi:hypothetical protein GCM10010344_57660 [Streptomyces bluensis]|nr:hypothetical protein GCM10010344_57660 [Streptomyces bluensis]